MTLSFFDCAKLEQRRAIDAFVRAVPDASMPLEMAEALKLGLDDDTMEADAEPTAEALAAATAMAVEKVPCFTSRGADYRKPLGDQYEALVGLVLTVLHGDVDRAPNPSIPHMPPGDSTALHPTATDPADCLRRSQARGRSSSAISSRRRPTRPRKGGASSRRRRTPRSRPDGA
eukprot:6432800-Prymnesium_polylepis.1